MGVKRPTADEMVKICATLGMNMSVGEIDSFIGRWMGAVAGYNALDAMPDELPPVKYPRTAGI